MALPSNYSCVCAAALSLLTFAAMQVFREPLAAERSTTILGGFIGSIFFIFFLTAVGNGFTMLFGRTYQVKIVPEVAVCLVVSVFVSGLVHRVSASTCLIFSLLALYFMNRISQATYSSSSAYSQTSSAHKSPQGVATPKSPRGKRSGKGSS
ncbi:Protein KRTCAP2 homolog [Geodia barretti]|uniref:Protein KRTCAP2 homolog n=1 Tax=Geodia barretti TaxID=519541 RepID=A0AA35R6N4_GEOBA|nr:Protein KRTCAP2 homolog [Geodia barretti]